MSLLVDLSLLDGESFPVKMNYRIRAKYLRDQRYSAQQLCARYLSAVKQKLDTVSRCLAALLKVTSIHQDPAAHSLVRQGDQLTETVTAHLLAVVSAILWRLQFTKRRLPFQRVIIGRISLAMRSPGPSKRISEVEIAATGKRDLKMTGGIAAMSRINSPAAFNITHQFRLRFRVGFRLDLVFFQGVDLKLRFNREDQYQQHRQLLAVSGLKIFTSVREQLETWNITEMMDTLGANASASIDPLRLIRTTLIIKVRFQDQHHRQEGTIALVIPYMIMSTSRTPFSLARLAPTIFRLLVL